MVTIIKKLRKLIKLNNFAKSIKFNIIINTTLNFSLIISGFRSLQIKSDY